MFQSLKGILVNFNVSGFPQAPPRFEFQSLKGILVNFNRRISIATISTQ
ncbi:hypothetical protein CKA32_001417 [Geitlerinema sp. FC II]|nr:hypothetical protein CKA32_001417 [Geitlerinema sp. FC II]